MNSVDSKPKRGRPHTPCPRCGTGKREYQLLVQTRPVGESLAKAKYNNRSSSSTVTVCAECAGFLRAKLTMLLAEECSQ